VRSILPVAGDDNTPAGDKRVNNDLKKALEISTLRAVRAMRSVYCQTLRGKNIWPLSSLSISATVLQSRLKRR
jgi:hypothetical protein